MATLVQTPVGSIADTTGQAVTLAYGYVWAAGKRAAYYQLQDTGNHALDYTRAGIWLLGEGEWDGPLDLWINDVLVWRGSDTITSTWEGWSWKDALDNKQQRIVFNFHAGQDAVIGTGSTPSSYGPDQGMDVLWKVFPPGITPLRYSRLAYYALMRKQPIINQTNTHQDDPSQWTDIAPTGTWRAMKCRIFDAAGNMTAYAFTTNPVWHWVDVRLRRKLFREYNVGAGAIDGLPGAVAACFDWSKVYASAQYCDEILANGRRRFTGSYAFSNATSLQAIEEQIAQVCRGYYTSYAGKYAMNIDRPRPVAFTFRLHNVLPGSFSGSEAKPHVGANRIVGKFRDLLVPKCSDILSITSAANGRPQVTTKEPHPCNAGDYIAMGGTDTTYDSDWKIFSVPAVINPGTPNAVYPTTMILERKGSNYPAAVGAGGSLGLIQSRFAERTPLFRHRANELARGAVAVQLTREHNPAKSTIDFATSTYDQVARVASYELRRSLGADTVGTNGLMHAPYVLPRMISLRCSMFEVDVAGNLVRGVEPGDRVTIDPTVSRTYAGDYEVLDPMVVHVPNVRESSGPGTLQPDDGSGEIEFTLGAYDEENFIDESDDTAAGYPSVPGSDPGNESSFTGVDTADGEFVFFTGLQDSGTQFQLPSTGFSVDNLLAWASAAGSNIKSHSAHTIRLCDASTTRQLTLTYSDAIGHTWSGAVGFAALSWIGTGTKVAAGGLTWLELTLLGGEQIAFACGIVADGTTISAPAGFTLDPDLCVAYIHDQAENANIMYIAGAYVDAGGVVHVDVSDHTGHTWHGNASVLAFAFKNNGGGFTVETSGGTKWVKCVLGNGKKFGVGVAKSLANGATFGVTADAGLATTLQAIVGSSYGQEVDNWDHAQGIGGCYLDGDGKVVIYFQNGNDSHPRWYGKADVFGLYCEAATAIPTLVTVTPASASIAQGAQLQFTAAVSGNANQSVNWSVDGIIGGNGTVGTIDATGLYSAPSASGNHTITATSIADRTASGSAAVSVTGSGSGDGGWIVVED